MLRLAALLLLSGCLLVEANRCRYRELNRAPPLEVTRPRPRICRGAGSFIGDDYWTSIGYDGQIRDGRSRGDFLVFDQISNGYIAYWITRTKYGNVHYEAFGHAFVRPDGRTCAWFVGKEKEIVEVCGGFRILSRSRYNPAEPIPFEWILATPETHSRDTLGFHTHRIGKYSWQGENFYGDARTQDKNFQGVSPASETFVEVTEPFDFERKVWLLRRKADASLTPPEPLRIEQPPPDKAGWRYADPHTQEGLVYQVAQQDPVRPYAPSDSRDPRYYDPRYWFDRRNWKWINGQWSYEPGNFEYYEIDPQYVRQPAACDREPCDGPPAWVGTVPDSRDKRYYDPRYWYDRRNWKKVDGKLQYDPGNYEYFTEDYYMRSRPAEIAVSRDTPPSVLRYKPERADDKDPRYYDPKYWYDKRNWNWDGEKWTYNPGNYEFFEASPSYYRLR